ncbi:MAG: FemAB family XrtA/PEP-CTERM system-associated protein [Sphingomonadaceae bacterium]
MGFGSPTFSVRCVALAQADEAQRIDAFVRSHPCATPFHLAGWSRAVAKGCGQKSHYLLAEDGAGMIAGVLPLTEVHSPLFGRALVSSGFAVGGGILAETSGAAQQLTEAAVDLAARLSCPTLELRGGALPGLGSGWHHDDTTYVGFVRDLATDDEAELLAIPRKQRAEVRKSLAFDLQVEVGSTQADRDAHYAVYATSVRNLGTPVFPKSLFAAVLEEFGDDADILTVRHEGKAIASVLSVYFGGSVMPYWGGGTADARTWRANDLMYFALMGHARQKGCTRFDFGRSKAGTGAAAFKHNWGFSGVPLPYAKHVAAGEAMREINPLDPRYRLQVQLWQKLPLWAANRIGPLIARGLG